MVPNSRLILNAVKDANDSIKSKSTNFSDKMNLDIKVKHDEQQRKPRPVQEDRTSSVRTRRAYKVKNVGYKKQDNRENLDYSESDEEVTFTITMNNEIKSNKRERTVIDNTNSSSKDIDMDLSDIDSAKKVKKVKCEYWPLCKRGGECLFWHPIELCKNLPKCLFGDKVGFWYVYLIDKFSVCIYIPIHLYLFLVNMVYSVAVKSVCFFILQDIDMFYLLKILLLLQFHVNVDLVLITNNKHNLYFNSMSQRLMCVCSSLDKMQIWFCLC